MYKKLEWLLLYTHSCPIYSFKDSAENKQSKTLQFSEDRNSTKHKLFTTMSSTIFQKVRMAAFVHSLVADNLFIDFMEKPTEKPLKVVPIRQPLYNYITCSDSPANFYSWQQPRLRQVTAFCSVAKLCVHSQLHAWACLDSLQLHVSLP